MSFFMKTFSAYIVSLVVVKKLYVDIEGQTKKEILKHGLYHITKRENAEKIMKDGHINPSKRLEIRLW